VLRTCDVYDGISIFGTFLDLKSCIKYIQWSYMDKRMAKVIGKHRFAVIVFA
jgi:hypothetical protein